MKLVTKSNIARLLTASLLVFALSVSLTAGFGQEAFASIQDGVDAAQGDDQTQTDISDSFKSVTNILLFIIGAVAVIMLVIGGIRYTVSNGDQSAVKAAKDTILYAVIGIIVALLAYAIVNYVIGSLI